MERRQFLSLIAAVPVIRYHESKTADVPVTLYPAGSTISFEILDVTATGIDGEDAAMVAAARASLPGIFIMRLRSDGSTEVLFEGTKRFAVHLPRHSNQKGTAC